MSISETARHLNVSRKTVSLLVNGKTSLSPEMAVRLELAFGQSAESWLAAQAAYDIWQLEAKRDSLGVHVLAA